MEAGMSSVDARGETATGSPPVKPGEMRLEAIVLSVSDVDRAKQFYESLGWRLDVDVATGDDFRQSGSAARGRDRPVSPVIRSG
jgi:catechol-2,3-dioxygenase